MERDEVLRRVVEMGEIKTVNRNAMVAVNRNPIARLALEISPDDALFLDIPLQNEYIFLHGIGGLC